MAEKKCCSWPWRLKTVFLGRKYSFTWYKMQMRKKSMHLSQISQNALLYAWQKAATLRSPNLLTKVKPNHISTTIFVELRQRKSILVPAWCGHFYQHSAHSQQITDNVEEKEKIENGLDLVWRSGAFISVPSMHFTMFSYKLLNICCSPQKYQNTLTVHFRLFMRIPLLWLTSIVKY